MIVTARLRRAGSRRLGGCPPCATRSGTAGRQLLRSLRLCVRLSLVQMALIPLDLTTRVGRLRYSTVLIPRRIISA